MWDMARDSAGSNVLDSEGVGQREYRNRVQVTDSTCAHEENWVRDGTSAHIILVIEPH